MSDTNSRTLHSYDMGVQAYVNGTGQKTTGSQKEWLDFVFNDVPKDAKILEIGSAFGRDASYLISKGYQPAMTDGSRAFVEYLNEHGFTASKLDIVNQQPKGHYDIILACAVFLHFDNNDFRQAVLHVRDALATNGRFAFSLKQGDGEEWSDHKMSAHRYFKYWKKDELQKVLHQLGMKAIDFQSLSDDKWLHVIAIKDQTAS